MTVQQFLDTLFAQAGRAGFEAYEAFYSNNDSFRAMVFQGKVDDYKVSTSSGLGFRGLFNGHMGYAYTEALDEDAAAMLVKRAKENALILDSQDAQFIYGGGSSYQTVNAWYDALEPFTAADKIALALEMEAAAKAASPLVKSVGYCMVGSGSGQIRLVNSRGLDLSFRSNGLYAYIEPILEHDGKMVDGHAYGMAHKPSDLNPQTLAQEAVGSAMAKLNASPVPSGKYPVLLHNEAAFNLLDTFDGIFSAESAQKGLSLLRNRMGERIAGSAVTLVDDPLMPEGPVSRPFDGEGVPTHTKHVIEQGQLTTLLHNLKTAAKDGVATTGNASKGSFKSPVGIAPTNFFFQPGADSPELMRKTMGSGLIITELEGLHAGANTISGDFSLAAKGFLVENGEQTRAVEQITVAGNFYELLQDIEAVGNDLRFDLPGGACVGSPTLFIRKLSVAGGT